MRVFGTLRYAAKRPGHNSDSEGRGFESRRAYHYAEPYNV